jgi:hypothetical protein
VVLVGRATPSVREKYLQLLNELEAEFVELLRRERREAYVYVKKAWGEELGAVTNYPNPYLLDSLLLVSVLDLEWRLRELERRLRDLEDEVERISSG